MYFLIHFCQVPAYVHVLFKLVAGCYMICALIRYKSGSLLRYRMLQKRRREKIWKGKHREDSTSCTPIKYCLPVKKEAENNILKYDECP
jgi:hypothetical protein